MKAPSRGGDVTAAGPKGLANSMILHILYDVAERVPQRHSFRSFFALRQNQFRQIFRRNNGHCVRQNVHGVFNGMLKFTDISGPVVILESLQCLPTDIFDVFHQTLVVLDDEGLGQKRNVLFSLPQRRDADIDHAQPVKEVSA